MQACILSLNCLRITELKTDQFSEINGAEPSKHKDGALRLAYLFKLVTVIGSMILYYSGFGPFDNMVLTTPGNQRCNQTKTLPWVVKT